MQVQLRHRQTGARLMESKSQSEKMQSRHTVPLLPPPSCLVEACLFVSQAEIELLKFFWPS